MTTVDSSLLQCSGRGPEPIAKRRVVANSRSWNELRLFVRDSWLAHVALAIIVALVVLAGLQMLGVFEPFAGWSVLRNVSGWVGPAAAVGAGGAAAAAAASGAGDAGGGGASGAGDPAVAAGVAAAAASVPFFASGDPLSALRDADVAYDNAYNAYNAAHGLRNTQPSAILSDMQQATSEGGLKRP